MKICIAGKNDIAVECAAWLLSEKIVNVNDLLVCFNKTDDGTDSFQRSFRRFSQKQGLAEVSLEQLYAIDDLIFFSLEFERIIVPDKFICKRLFNTHFSLLPQYKGMYTSVWPILNGDSRSGVTLHKIEQGIDTGDIIDQCEFQIEADDNCRDLYFKYIECGIAIFKKNFLSILQGNYTVQKQSSLGSSYYSKSSIDYGNIKIDLNKTAYEIRNQIRAFNFKEYQIPKIYGYQIKSSEILGSLSKERPGIILQKTDAYIDIATIDYDLRLKRMSV